ncbi:peptidase M48 Ste24p [Nitratireductor indicus C115]|uniref:Peptidase M48 Ste24p n=1 Tax=Nitratireductor indicus C115 TaxID=1231190 RepID=K2P136_9HYPH|nr:M48 family metallopeptidase [Nitratireductor indicus]EKF41056.1 peptidase M48 Ste24p [Nitratireductor indicus C115]SFQ74091.1 Peptidase family M48 [Nitratireductor indicus]
MIEGRYFPPASSAVTSAVLSGTPEALRLQETGGQEPMMPVLQSVSDPVAGVPRKFTFADGGVFEAAPGADVDGFLGTHKSFFSRLTRFEANLKYIALAAMVTIGLLFVAYRHGIPLLASGAAVMTPAPIVAAIDFGTLETVDRTLFEPTELPEKRQEALRALFAELSFAAGKKGPPLQLLLRKGGKTIGANAIALPGGTIIVTDELVTLAATDDEIAGVMAHEIGHVRERHSLQQIYRVLGIGFMVALVGGDASQLVDDVVTQASAVQTLVYSREFETSADLYSVDLMSRVGRDPVSFVDLLDRIGKDDEAAQETYWFSTHPGMKERRAAVEKKIRELAGG